MSKSGAPSQAMHQAGPQGHPGNVGATGGGHQQLQPPQMPAGLLTEQLATIADAPQASSASPSFRHRDASSLIRTRFY
jgi:hypothetical protein